MTTLSELKKKWLKKPDLKKAYIEQSFEFLSAQKFLSGRLKRIVKKIMK